MIIRGSGSGKTNELLTLISKQSDIGKIYLYAKDSSEPKCEFLITWEDTGIKHLNDSNPFTECSNTMSDVYNNIDYYNPIRKRKISIMFDDLITDI